MADNPWVSMRPKLREYVITRIDNHKSGLGQSWSGSYLGSPIGRPVRAIVWSMIWNSAWDQWAMDVYQANWEQPHG